jgi:hypothetical protein
MGELRRLAKEKHWSVSDWLAIISAESSGNPDARNGQYYGLGQLSADAQRLYGGGPGSTPAQEVDAMARYIVGHGYGNPTRALAARNSRNPKWYAGGGVVDKVAAGAGAALKRSGLSSIFDRQYPRHFWPGPLAGKARFTKQQVRTLARLLGLDRAGQIHSELITEGESMRYPGIWGQDHNKIHSRGLGLYMMTPATWGAGDRAAMDKLGGESAMFNPWKAGLMMRRLVKEYGWAPWLGTKFVPDSMQHSGRVVRGVQAPSGAPGGRQSPWDAKILKHTYLAAAAKKWRDKNWVTWRLPTQGELDEWYPVRAGKKSAAAQPKHPGRAPRRSNQHPHWPLPIRGRIIGRPYQGTHTLGNWQSDNAIDIGAPFGTPVDALDDGRVIKVGGHHSFAGRFGGLSLTLQGKRNAWFYTHMSKRLAGVGQRVKQGQTIGATGKANGVPHLHLGQQHGDPLKSLRFAGGGFVGKLAQRLAGGGPVVTGGHVQPHTHGPRIPRPNEIPIANMASAEKHWAPGIAKWTKAADDAVRTFTRREQVLARPDEKLEFVISPADGSAPYINKAAIAQRVKHLNELIGLKQKVVEAYDRLRQAIAALKKAYEDTVAKLKKQLQFMRKGTRRTGVLNQIGAYQTRVDELQSQWQGADDSHWDAGQQLLDLIGERDSIYPDAQKQVTDSAASSGDKSPDQQALLDQANARIAVLERDTQVQEGTIAAFRAPGDIGTGAPNAYDAAYDLPQPGQGNPYGAANPYAASPTPGAPPSAAAVAFGGLEPGVPYIVKAMPITDPAGQRELAGATAAGAGYQAPRPSSIEVPGL